MKRLTLVLAMLALISCKKEKVKEDPKIVFQKTYSQVYSKYPGGGWYIYESDYAYDITVWDNDVVILNNTSKSSGKLLVDYHAKCHRDNSAAIYVTNGWATVVINFFNDSLHLSLIHPGTFDSDEFYGKP